VTDEPGQYPPLNRTDNPPGRLLCAFTALGIKQEDDGSLTIAGAFVRSLGSPTLPAAFHFSVVGQYLFDDASIPHELSALCMSASGGSGLQQVVFGVDPHPVLPYELATFPDGTVQPLIFDVRIRLEATVSGRYTVLLIADGQQVAVLPFDVGPPLDEFRDEVRRITEDP
jgi:hypothetical protein